MVILVKPAWAEELIAQALVPGPVKIGAARGETATPKLSL